MSLPPRLRFAVDEASSEEARARADLDQRIAAFWQRVRRALPREPGSDEGVLLGELRPELDAALDDVHPGLGWDASANGTLVVSADGERALRPLADRVVTSAPELAGWTVRASRPALDPEHAIARAERRTGSSFRGARARAGFTRGHLLEVVVSMRGCASREDERAREAAYLAVEALLGERVVDDWIAAIDAVPLVGGGLLRVMDANAASEAETTFPLIELPLAMERARAGVRENLPRARLSEAAGELPWTLFELEPELSSDYARHDDIALGSSVLPELMRCFLEDAPFTSSRFSAFDERFCYLKLDGDGRSPEELMQLRTAVEDAVGARLHETRAGAVVGNGLGVRYAYVVVGLDDLDGAVEAVLAAARDAGVAQRSWLLFCDSDLGAEWLGVWPGTPAPP